MVPIADIDRLFNYLVGDSQQHRRDCNGPTYHAASLIGLTKALSGKMPPKEFASTRGLSGYRRNAKRAAMMVGGEDEQPIGPLGRPEEIASPSHRDAGAAPVGAWAGAGATTHMRRNTHDHSP